MKCRILMTTGKGQKVAGVISFASGKVQVKVTPGYERMMQSILDDEVWVRGREISRATNPAKWFQALPLHYHGSYLRAEMVED